MDGGVARKVQRAAPGEPCQLAARVLSGVVPGDHACCSFGSDEEHRALVGRYVLDATRRGERVLYLADRSDEETIRAYVDAAGVDADRCLASGQLDIRDCSEVLSAAGAFDPECQVAALDAERRRARRDGFTALAATGEMSWALGLGPEVDRLVAYEEGSARVFAAGDIRGLCQYDRRLFSADLLATVTGAHGVDITTGVDCTSATRGALTISECHEVSSLALEGELDFPVAPYLSARLEDHLSGYDDVVLDMRAVEFVDLTGARVLVRAARRLTGDRRVVVTHAPPALARIMAVCDWLDQPGLVVLPRSQHRPGRRITVPMARSRRRPGCESDARRAG